MVMLKHHPLRHHPRHQHRSTSPSTSPSTMSVRDFFLKRLQPRFARHKGTGRGRSARIQRFRYGESLTSEECVARLAENETRKTSNQQGQGRGRGRGRGTGISRSRSPRQSTSQAPQPSASRANLPSSPSSSTCSEDDNALCKKCRSSEGERWISCDVCDNWYHMNCVGLSCTPEMMEAHEWMCNDCTQ